jgi:hypothetical protein
MSLKTFEGKTLDEWRNTPTGQLTHNQLKFITENEPKEKTEPGFFSSLARTGVLLTKAATRTVADKAIGAVDTIKEAAANEQKLAEANKIKDVLYRRAMLDTALSVGDISRKEYDEELEALDSKM